ncbi:hypothetical protein DFH09DRAFT_401539 [Mycena vulgaris]|nr:hypothetical protein DFH09DRAFT_401539 [Mycena vulgaris]
MPDAVPWPAVIHAAFFAQVWCTYRAGFEPIRDLPGLGALPVVGGIPAWVGAGALTSTHENGEHAGESSGHAPPPGMSHSPSPSDSSYRSISSAGHSSVSSVPASYSHSHPHAYTTHSSATSTSSSGSTKKNGGPCPPSAQAARRAGRSTRGGGACCARDRPCWRGHWGGLGTPSLSRRPRRPMRYLPSPSPSFSSSRRRSS